MVTPIYFVVDYDASDADMVALGEYFRIVYNQVRNAGYYVGVYGSGLVCQHLSSLGYTSHTYLAESHGWMDYEDWLPYACLIQTGETTVRGLDVDLVTSNGDGGGWQP